MVVTGLIRPPPEIRAVADRTALYVSKNGRAFEQKILSSSKGKTPKFAFLHETSPFHAYYEDRVQFYSNGGKDEDEKEIEKPQEEEKLEPQEKKEESKSVQSALDPVAQAVLAQRQKINKIKSEAKTDETTESQIKSMIPAPPAYHFINVVAPTLTPMQIEIIQCTAQLAALEGTGAFLQQLTHREWNNPMYSFCQPRHPHFPFFSALVDSYKQVLKEWTKDTIQDAETVTVQSLLENAAYRAEYQREMETNEEEKEADMIDWQDFVVVETINFDKDEKVVTLPPPPVPGFSEGRGAMDESDEEGEAIRVVPTYQPKIAQAGSTADTMVVDPITGKSMRVQDMPEHMRIQLLDPKWAEERKRYQEKQKESNLVAGDTVASNLERLNPSFAKQSEQLAGSKRRQESNTEEAPVGPSIPAVAKRAKTETQVRAAPTGRGPVPPPQPEDVFASAAVGESSVFDEAAPAKQIVAEGVCTLQIRVPNDPSQMAWNFYGQILSMPVDVKLTAKQVKNDLSKKHLNGMPINKIQLKDTGTGAFLKDNMTLADQNIEKVATLELKAKSRGGRK